MRKTKSIRAICAFVVALLIGSAFIACKPGNSPSPPADNADKPEWTIVSPDEKIKAEIYFKDGQIFYSVAKDGIVVVEKSNLGMATDQCEFIDLSFVSEKT